MQTQSPDEINALFEQVDKGFAALESYIDLVELDPKQRTVTLESLSNMYGTSLEGHFNSIVHQGTLSTEGIKDSIVKVLGTVTSPLRKVADELQGYIQISDTTIEELTALKKRVSALPSSYKADFTMKNSKYFSLTNKQYVSNYKEYLETLEYNLSILEKFNKVMAEFTEDDFLNSYKTLGSLVTGYEDHYRVMLARLEELFKDSIDSKYTNVIVSNAKYKEIHSDPLLGMSVIKYTMPSSPLTKSETFSELKKRGGNYYISVVRAFPLSPSGTVNFEGMSKSDLDKMINIGIKLSSSYQAMRGFKKAMSVMGSGGVIGDNLFSAAFPLSWYKFILASYRLMSRISWMIYNSAYPSMNLSKGITEKLIDVVERAVK